MLFWALALSLALLVAVMLARAALHAKTPKDAQNFDLKVYRDQLMEVERDLQRGVLSGKDAARIRAEVSRRVLAADARRQDAGEEGAQKLGVASVSLGIPLAALVAGGAALYAVIGAPGYPDMPLQARLETAQELMAERPSQASYEAQQPPVKPANADPEFAALVAELRAVLTERPDDLRGFRLLARNETTLGNYQAAYKAQQRVIALTEGDTRAEDYAQLARLMISATEGYVSPEAENALRSALTLDPTNGFARYYYGLMYLQNGRPDRTFVIWRNLLEESPPNAPWLTSIQGSIEDLAWVAGVNYTPQELAGPSVEDMQAAQSLSPQERSAMIAGMVSSLAERLATEGGPAAEWARLINAYAVLGERAQAMAILKEAEQVFAESETAMTTLRMAAEQAGLVD